MPQRQPLELHDYSAGRYFRYLEDFLETKEIDKRMAAIQREVQIESGVYKRDWVIPKRAWWLGFEQARDILRKNGSFRRAITPAIEPSLLTAVKMWRLGKSMPDWKKEEFKSRILGDDVLTPTLFEIDVAAHFYELNYEIDWFEPESEDGQRTPEFVALRKDSELEVECKAKQADSGRRVERAAFYRAVDRFIPILQSKALMGLVFLTVPRRLPVKHSWYEQIRELLENEARPSADSFDLSDGTRIELGLEDADDLLKNPADVQKEVDLGKHPYAHYALFGDVKGNRIANPLVFRLKSERADEFLLNIMTSLRDAQRQFSGQRAGIINCHIPEVDSFEGLQSDSALQKMHMYSSRNTRGISCMQSAMFLVPDVMYKGMW